MPVVTKINTPKKSPQKRAVYLDDKWAFNLTQAIVDRCKLVVGMTLSAEEVEKIQGMKSQQKVLDKAIAILGKRLHSKAELEKKLAKAEYTPEQIASAMESLERFGYVDDLRFAKAKAHGAAELRKYGKRRAGMELTKAGVTKETAQKALEAVYDPRDSSKVARELAAKKSPGLKKLDKFTAQRRLTGMLLRRGFTFDEIKPVIQEVLGDVQETVVSKQESPKMKDGGDYTAEHGRDAHATDGADEAPGWREGLLSHHVKREKPKSKWRRR